ncbi:MAG: SDR family oxidoreductase [Pirellulaceae bacterium]|nr:SDR family oxidoreductase [Pirellulaceae bacterium]
MTANVFLNDKDTLRDCLLLLDQLCQQPELCLTPDSPYSELMQRIALLNRRVKSARKREVASRDQRQVEVAAIRHQRKTKVYGQYALPVDMSHLQDEDKAAQGLAPPTLAKRRLCYICKQPFWHLHPFYDSLCPECADLNYSKRHVTADLSGRIALVTGGRIKIGFQIALKLLRAGAEVAVTSRFPRDTLQRYQQETDSPAWLDRLKIFSADFRFLPTVQAMCAEIRTTYGSLDLLINNAAQTVRRPPEYYAHLLVKEQQPSEQQPSKQQPSESLSAMPNCLASVSSQSERATTELIHDRPPLHIATLLAGTCVMESDGRHARELFPMGKLDSDGQQLDRRDDNSWIAKLEDVQLPELLEVHAVNALVPFILIQDLQPLMQQSVHPQRFIVNVSAMEGHFETGHKTGLHPHTNMAKAAMNMITRTSAERFAELGIFMNSVDTGWVTNEYPLPKVEKMQGAGFEPPLDEIDGAARVLDPVFAGIHSGTPQYGKFFKDYRETNW